MILKCFGTLITCWNVLRDLSCCPQDLSTARFVMKVGTCVLFSVATSVPGQPSYGEPEAASSDNPPARFTDSSRRAKLAEAIPAIDELMAQRYEELNLPGLAYGVVVDDEPVALKGLGVRDVAADAPVDENTIFRIASMTKSFIALAILKLRDAGELLLDDPIAKHIPELASVSLPTGDSGPVTIRHLLRHNAGFPEDNPFADRQMAMSDSQFSTLVEQGLSFSNAPGIGFEYSNLGYALLGRTIARVSGTSYQNYVQREILQPLGMTDTFWEVRAAPATRLARGYRSDGETHVVEELADGGDGFSSIGALMTSSRDLARWIALMMSAFPARDDPEQPPALRRTLREMQFGAGSHLFFVNREMPGSPMIAGAATAGYGLFAYRNCNFSHGVAHAGGLPGYGSFMRWLPKHGVGVFAMANLTYAPMGLLTDEMLGLLAETGALEPRAPMPSRALRRAAAETASLIDSWDDDRARKIVASNFFLDTSLEERREAITTRREGLGTCQAEPIEAKNALRGTFRMTCEQGWLDVTLTLTPTRPPLVQYLSVMSGRPLSDTLKQAVADIVRAMGRGGHDLRFTPDLDRHWIGAMLENARFQYGTCRFGEVLDGDGTTNARVRLSCDRGELFLSILMDGELMARITLKKVDEAACIP